MDPVRLKNWNALIHRKLHAYHYPACTLSFASLHHPAKESGYQMTSTKSGHATLAQ
jgi:hypothetical protein